MIVSRVEEPRMSFTTPIALVLFVLLPLAAYIGFPRYAYRRTRDLASLIVRLLMLTLLILAISGAQIVRAADKLAVVFLVDVSDSVDPITQQAEFDYVREAVQNLGINDSAGVVMFGANALVERPVSAVRDLGDVQSAPLTANTDIAEAVRLGLALFPADAARRLVIVSDGRPTVGDTEAAAGLAAAASVPIDYVWVSPTRTPEVQVTAVDVPSAVNANQQFDLSFTVEAEASSPAHVSVFAGGALLYEDDVNLRAGQNRYSLSLQSGEGGFRDFRVQVDPQSGDGYYQNNQLSAFSRVVGAPRVLILASDPLEAQYIAPALENAGLTVEVRTPESLPIGLAALAEYDSILIANVPARLLSQRRMEALQSYVRDLGGGLVFIGGDQSYGPGGYFQTPLEETLPLETRIRDQQRLPQLTIAYVIDTSGSMGAIGPSGVENVELAKEAIIRSIDFLQPTDRAGVANFDTAGTWIAQVQPVLDRFALQNLVATLRASGGTDILAGMNLVTRALLEDTAERKHIILLTDGGADPAGLIELTGSVFTSDDITTSVIAIGAGSAGFLDDMANAGGGNFYLIDTVDQIPLIFTQETVLATRSYITEEQFFPVITANSPIIAGLTDAPPLQGYVATSAKDTATVILRGGGYQDPLLAAWQYGLGRSVAFTSDATSRWASGWVDWAGYSPFWANIVRWTITESADNNVETRVSMLGETGQVVIDARDPDGNFLNGLTLELALVNPQLETERVPLVQVAPGRYEATFHPGTEGAYLLRIAGGGEEIAVNQTTGWVMSYSPEYDLRLLPLSVGVLAEIATITNGRELDIATPQDAFARTFEARTATTPIIWPLLIAALLLLPLDIALRRLLITRGDFARVWAAITGGQANLPSSERLSSLMTARDRARQQARTETPPPAPSPRAVGTPAPSSGGSGTEPVPQAAPTPNADVAPTPESGRNIGSRLLQRRRPAAPEEKDPS